MTLVSLKVRSEFLRIRGGAKWQGPAFLLEAKRALQAGPPRFGFTVTKKLASRAVVRNRMRRRLREAVRSAMPHAADTMDFVIVARPAAQDRPFEALCRDMRTAIERTQRQLATDSRGPATNVRQNHATSAGGPRTGEDEA